MITPRLARAHLTPAGQLRSLLVRDVPLASVRVSRLNWRRPAGISRFTYWTAYDERMSWGIEAGATSAIGRSLAGHGAAVAAIEADLTDTGSPGLIFDEAGRRLGIVTALVMCHCESVDSGLLDTSIESFDRHFAVNARATWLLIREYGRRFRGAARYRADRQPHQRPRCRQPALRCEQGHYGPDHPGRGA